MPPRYAQKHPSPFSITIWTLKIKDLSFAKNNTIPSCVGSSLRVLEPAVSRTGLFSYSGSGNTWLRYLIQKSTGYVTGVDRYFYLSIKNKTLVDSFVQNNYFYKNGYPGELISDGSAIGKNHAFKK